MITRVVTSRHDQREYTVEIQQGVQYFRLDYSGSRKDAMWMALMFRKALKSHDKEKSK